MERILMVRAVGVVVLALICTALSPVTARTQEGTAPDDPDAPLQWVGDADGGVPATALPILDGDRKIFTCRAKLGEALLVVGEIVEQGCVLGVYGAEISVPRYEVLVGSEDGVAWIDLDASSASEAILAGHSGGRDVPLCLVRHDDGLHPGMVVGGKCHFGDDGNEIMSMDYLLGVSAAGSGSRD